MKINTIIKEEKAKNLDSFFDNTAPKEFKLKGRDKIKVNSWQDLLIKTYEILFKEDKDKFFSLRRINSIDNTGPIFSTRLNNMRKPKIMKDSNYYLYYETGRPPQAIVNILKQVLKIYGYEIEDYKIYLI